MSRRVASIAPPVALGPTPAAASDQPPADGSEWPVDPVEDVVVGSRFPILAAAGDSFLVSDHLPVVADPVFLQP